MGGLLYSEFREELGGTGGGTRGALLTQAAHTGHITYVRCIIRTSAPSSGADGRRYRRQSTYSENRLSLDFFQLYCAVNNCGFFVISGISYHS